MPTKSTAAAAPLAPPVREAQRSAVQFPTQFYQANGILQCSNGDKVRSGSLG